MIDIENEIFTLIATSLRANFTGIKVYGDEAKRTSPSYPSVTIIETGNVPYFRSSTADSQENHTTLTYTVNVYTTDGKAKNKSIRNHIDELFTSYGFRRVSSNPISNMADGDIYRTVSVYSAVADANKTIYRS